MSFPIDLRFVTQWMTVLILAFSVQAPAQQWFVVAQEVQPQYQELEGVIEAISESTVMAQVSGQVKGIYVDVDDKVAKGQLLLEIDDTVLKANLAEANANIAVAKAQFTATRAEYQRLTNLKSEKFVSETQLTQAQSAMEMAQAQIQVHQAQVDSVKQQLAFSRISAPYAGVVLARHIEVGETAMTGQPLLTGFALNKNRLVAHIPQHLLPALNQSEFNLFLVGENAYSPVGPVTVAPKIDEATRTVMVRTDLDASELMLRPGSFVKVAIKTGQKAVILIPQTAVFHQGDMQGVFVAFNDTTVLRQIRTGKKIGNMIEVISGLSESEKIAIDANVLTVNLAVGQ